MRAAAEPRFLLRLPLFLVICGIASVAMYLPAVYALALDDHPVSRSFFYAGTLGLIVITLVALAISARPARHGPSGQLLSLFATFTVLPVFLAVPLHDALITTSFFNAYFDMVSSLTTTGANIFADPARLAPPLHLWRAEVGWLGGLLMWVAASAILAPLSLGGFELTTRGQPGRRSEGPREGLSDPRLRLGRITLTLGPIYAALTGVVWILLLLSGEDGLTAICHAMSVMATSGISPVGGVQNAQAGFAGEAILFLFLFFALSRLTFSGDTVARGHGRVDRDPEFLIGVLIVLSIPVLLFLRHWWGAIDIDAGENTQSALRAFWGAMFTVLSFLSTAGFESADWGQARDWSGLGAPGLILLGLAVIGGGVATTAGGVKLLRVYALYLNGLREMEKLVHPSSVGRSGAGGTQRIQRGGAFIAWIFFMLFAMSLALITVILAALGSSFDQALVLSIAALSTTGPLIQSAAETPIQLIELGTAAKAVLCAAMVLGRLETLAIVALLTPNLWRG